ncbi:hypothetical protein D9753_11250 [Streptomyces dangxiongensis]|uniref:Uncharacterized protein n=1 Tax=Streptomyces dangxiongensis TaxID=1442032 RepID=A0A3G2JIK9_9ACTN|nr:hypothetical protein D9753_11250 [Streptomyces dangxiongensis]
MWEVAADGSADIASHSRNLRKAVPRTAEKIGVPYVPATPHPDFVPSREQALLGREHRTPPVPHGLGPQVVNPAADRTPPGDLRRFPEDGGTPVPVGSGSSPDPDPRATGRLVQVACGTPEYVPSWRRTGAASGSPKLSLRALRPSRTSRCGRGVRTTSVPAPHPFRGAASPPTPSPKPIRTAVTDPGTARTAARVPERVPHEQTGARCAADHA